MSPLPETIPPDPGKLRILVVDDEPTLRLGFAYALSNKTTVVETANNGRQALERIAEKTFDLMILDLRMPEMDGITLLETLRADGNRLPVVVCSAVVNPDAALRAIRLGVVDFLLKPVRPVDLRHVVEFVIRPDTQALSLALAAVRKREVEEAIRILEMADRTQAITACWLSVLKGIRDGEETHLIEEKLRLSLPVVAFNSTERL